MKKLTALVSAFALTSAFGATAFAADIYVVNFRNAAHEAFDRDIVPVFNKWVGLPGFAAVVDAKSKRVIGCVNSTFDANEMASEIRKMASRAQGSAFLSNASVSTKTTRCPAAHNVDPGR